MKPFDAKEATRDLRMLNEPGYGGGMNICYNDGYFANSLIRKWGMSISELQKRCKNEMRSEKVKELAAQVRALSKKDRALFDGFLIKRKA